MLSGHPRLALRLIFHRSQDPSGKKPLENFRVLFGCAAAKPGFAVDQPAILLRWSRGFVEAETIERLYPRWQRHWQAIRTNSTEPISPTWTKILCLLMVHNEGTAETPPDHAEKQLYRSSGRGTS